MLPNVFPGAGDAPEYNTVDAALWFIEAWRAYVAASGDEAALRRAFPVLAAIVDALHARHPLRHRASTRPTGCCAPANRACSSPGWTPRSATGW